VHTHTTQHTCLPAATTTAEHRAHLRGEVASCSISGPSARAPGASSGDRKGMESVAGLLLKLMRMLPSRCDV
jgi:hypothetical protein